MPRPLKGSYDEQKPPFSYITLTAMAVWSSPQKMLPLSEIYKYITDKYPFYRKNTKKWQNSLRHNLSFNDCFIKIPREFDKAGKGSYWALHPKAIHMFENGSLLRRRRRFRVDRTEKNIFNEELATLVNFQRFLLSQQKNQVDLRQQQQSYHQPIWDHPSDLPQIPKVSTQLLPSATRPKRDFTIESLIGPDKPAEEELCPFESSYLHFTESNRFSRNCFYAPKFEIPPLQWPQYSTLHQHLQYQQHLQQHHRVALFHHQISHQLPHYNNITAV